MSPAPTLEQLSRLLLEVGEAGLSADVASVVAALLQALRRSLGFRFGWCGLLAERPRASPMLQCVSGIELPASFVREFRAVAPRDDWGRRVVEQPAVAHRWSGFEESDDLVDGFVRRHGMFHGMAQCLHGAFGGRDIAVAVYRERGAKAFSDAEAEIFRHTCRHIGNLWWHSVRGALATGDAAPRGARIALARADGVLLYAGAQVGALLDRCDDAWDGTQLAPALVAALGAPALRIGAARVDVAAAAGLVRLTLADDDAAPRLSPREWRAARLFADGQSYKEVARTLALSPATVRSYLQSAYARLGVANKVQLGRALDRQPPR